MNIIKKLDAKTKKIVGIFVVVFCLVLMGTGVAVYANNSAPPKEDKKLLKVVKEVTVEYGTKVPTDIKTFLDTKKLNKDEKALVLKNTKVDLVKIRNEDGKDYPALGNYTVSLTYKDEKATTKVVVKDTTSPAFNEVNEISFEQGTTDFDYTSQINANDLQEVSYEFKTDQVDVNTVGEYTVKAIATDKSKNKTEKDIKVTITSKPVDENNVTGGSDNGYNETGNTGGTSGNTGGGTGNQGNTGNTGNTGTIPPPPTPPAPHIHNVPSTNGDYYNTENDVDLAAYAFLFGEINLNGPNYRGYVPQYCSCGQIGIIYTYYVN